MIFFRLDTEVLVRLEISNICCTFSNPRSHEAAFQKLFRASISYYVLIKVIQLPRRNTNEKLHQPNIALDVTLIHDNGSSGFQFSDDLFF